MDYFPHRVFVIGGKCTGCLLSATDYCSCASCATGSNARCATRRSTVSVRWHNTHPRSKHPYTWCHPTPNLQRTHSLTDIHAPSPFRQSATLGNASAGQQVYKSLESAHLPGTYPYPNQPVQTPSTIKPHVLRSIMATLSSRSSTPASVTPTTIHPSRILVTPASAIAPISLFAFGDATCGTAARSHEGEDDDAKTEIGSPEEDMDHGGPGGGGGLGIRLPPIQTLPPMAPISPLFQPRFPKASCSFASNEQLELHAHSLGGPHLAVLSSLLDGLAVLDQRVPLQHYVGSSAISVRRIRAALAKLQRNNDHDKLPPVPAFAPPCQATFFGIQNITVADGNTRESPCTRRGRRCASLRKEALDKTVEGEQEQDSSCNQPTRMLIWFVTEVLRCSHTSINVLQVALAYLASAKPKIHKELRAAADCQADLAMKIAGSSIGKVGTPFGLTFDLGTFWVLFIYFLFLGPPAHIREAFPGIDWMGGDFLPFPLIVPRPTFWPRWFSRPSFYLTKCFRTRRGQTNVDAHRVRLSTSVSVSAPRCLASLVLGIRSNPPLGLGKSFLQPTHPSIFWSSAVPPALKVLAVRHRHSIPTWNPTCSKGTTKSTSGPRRLCTAKLQAPPQPGEPSCVDWDHEWEQDHDPGSECIICAPQAKDWYGFYWRHWLIVAVWTQTLSGSSCHGSAVYLYVETPSAEHTLYHNHPPSTCPPPLLPTFLELSSMALQRQHILDSVQAKKLSDKLVGTNYKLVLIQDSDVNSEEHNTSQGPLNATQPQPTSGPPPYTLPILYIGSRPAGTPGKAPPKGFHVGDVLGLTRDEYGLLGDITKTALKETPRINTNLSISRQRRAVDATISLLVKMLPEFEVYKNDRYWPFECMIYVKLKSFKESFNRRSMNIKLAQELMKTDPLNRDKALVKKRQLAKARGQASAKARAQARDRDRAPALVQAGTMPEAEAQVEANDGDLDASKPQESDSADAVEALTHEISSMSIFVPDNANTTMAAEEDDFEGPLLPVSLSNPT
ncbi:unnamed protein product, partial [Rhizoctonia solani]